MCKHASPVYVQFEKSKMQLDKEENGRSGKWKFWPDVKPFFFQDLDLILILPLSEYHNSKQTRSLEAINARKNYYQKSKMLMIRIRGCIVWGFQ